MNKETNIFSLCFIVGTCLLVCSLLLGCSPKTPSVQMSEILTQNAEDAKKIILDTNTLEQCKNASVAEINAIIRQANGAVVACQTEIQLEKKDTKFWFWAFIVSCGTSLALILSIIKRAIKI